jgi:multidrug transporter EmrE-like cation transporter
MIAPISSWAAAVADYTSGVTNAAGEPVSSLALFCRAIPYNFYSLLTLVFIVAIVLMNYRPGEGKSGNMASLLLLLLAGGGGDAMSKIFEELGNPAHSGHFLLYTFLVALALCISLCRIRGEKLGKWEVLFGLLIGIPNFFSAKFLLAALKDIAAVIVYPVYSVATILTVTVTGILLFREKLDKRQWIALAMILVALVLLNI